MHTLRSGDSNEVKIYLAFNLDIVSRHLCLSPMLKLFSIIDLAKQAEVDHDCIAFSLVFRGKIACESKKTKNVLTLRNLHVP